jgi:hypothetical protein
LTQKTPIITHGKTTRTVVPRDGFEDKAFVPWFEIAKVFTKSQSRRSYSFPETDVTNSFLASGLFTLVHLFPLLYPSMNNSFTALK